MGLFSFGRKIDNISNLEPLKTDVHSHLIYGVDDGAQTIEQSVELIRGMIDIGYKKIVTTPHIMGDFYRNSAENLLPKLDQLREELVKQNMDVVLECAAEYYLDEFFIQKLKSNEKLLSFGEGFVLFETSFMNPSNQLFEVIFDLLSNGYKPVMAHPERYIYLHESVDKYFELKEKGVFFQMNINSISGYYSKAVKRIAEKLIDAKLVDFLGTDCHNIRHLDNLAKSRQEKYFARALQLPLINKEVL